MKGPSLPPLLEAELVDTSLQCVPVRSGLSTVLCEASSALMVAFISSFCSGDLRLTLCAALSGLHASS